MLSPKRAGEERRVGGSVGLEHERPVGQRDELHLVSGSAVTLDGRDRVPLALSLEPRDACGQPLAGRVEGHLCGRFFAGAVGVALALRGPARLVHALVAVALDLALELVDELVDRRLVGRRSLACDEVRALS